MHRFREGRGVLKARSRYILGAKRLSKTLRGNRRVDDLPLGGGGTDAPSEEQ
jgi:hypothetical protein